MIPFYPPGVTTGRGAWSYDADHEEKWRILADIAYATAYGFSQCRMANPGTVLPANRITQRMAQLEAGWHGETGRTKGSRSLDPERDLGQCQREYLTERLTPFPQIKTPQRGPAR